MIPNFILAILLVTRRCKRENLLMVLVDLFRVPVTTTLSVSEKSSLSFFDSNSAPATAIKQVPLAAAARPPRSVSAQMYQRWRTLEKLEPKFWSNKLPMWHLKPQRRFPGNVLLQSPEEFKNGDFPVVCHDRRRRGLILLDPEAQEQREYMADGKRRPA